MDGSYDTLPGAAERARQNDPLPCTMVWKMAQACSVLKLGRFVSLLILVLVEAQCEYLFAVKVLVSFSPEIV